jgi:hypothetical protein
MKRSDAFRKLRTICARLDNDAPNPLPHYRVSPRRMWLFGDLLTDKPQPDEVDLLLFVDDHRSSYLDEELEEIAYRQAHRLPMPADEAAVRWRRGLQKVQVFPCDELSITEAEEFFALRKLGNIATRLMWQPGLDWESVLQDLEQHPTPWEAEMESKFHYVRGMLKARR